MSGEDYMVKPKPAPALNVPSSTSTCTVRIIDSTSRINFKTSLAVVPHIEGHDTFSCPAYSFLVTNHTHKRHILFDLGVRSDWADKFPPWLLKTMKEAPFDVTVDKDVPVILDEDKAGLGIKRSDIDTVIWSHHHWDHTGNMELFDKSTSLAVGPGFPHQHGYPTDKDSSFLDADIEGRKFYQFDFEKDGKGLKIGPFNAFDFFEDGSFYILDTPGHTDGHICGFARTSSNPDTFIFMGGDASHHPGEYRASEYVPLPSMIDKSIFKGMHAGCPGGMLQEIQRNKRADEAFYLPSSGFNKDEEKALHTISGLQVFDGHDNVLLVVAHDTSVLDLLRLYPEKMDDWYERGLGKQAHWRFLGDFEKAIKT